MRIEDRARLRHGAAVITLSIALATGARADDPIQVNPNRPTFATPALTTQFGVMELESGVQHSDGRDGGERSWSPFLLKLGLLKRVGTPRPGCRRGRRREPRGPEAVAVRGVHRRGLPISSRGKIVSRLDDAERV